MFDPHAGSGGKRGCYMAKRCEAQQHAKEEEGERRRRRKTPRFAAAASDGGTRLRLAGSRQCRCRAALPPFTFLLNQKIIRLESRRKSFR